MSDADAQFALSHRLWSEGRQSEALVAVDAALALRPDFAEAHYNRGAILQALNRTEEALAAYDRVPPNGATHLLAFWRSKLDNSLASRDAAA